MCALRVAADLAQTPAQLPFFISLKALATGDFAGANHRDVAVDRFHRNERVTCPDVLPGVLSAAECERAKGFARHCRRQDGGLVANQPGYRSVSSHWVMPTDAESIWLYGKVGAFAAEASKWYGFEIAGLFEPLLYLQYEAGDHFDWHLDAGIEGTCTRKLSITLQLSKPEDYAGGGLELFPQGELLESRHQGTGIVFPSFYPHRVAPVTHGVRHALVAWLHGPTFR